MATGLDTSIPLRALQGMYNPAETVGNQFRLKAMLSDQQARQQQLAMQQEEMAAKRDERQRASSLREALARAYNPETGSLDPKAAAGAYAGAGDYEGLVSFQKSQREAEKAKIEQGLTEVSAIAQLAGSARDQASYTQALQQAQEMGLDVSSLPPQFDPQVVDSIRARALDAKGQLEQVWKEKEFDLDERKFSYQRQNDAAQRAVQIRGQNMADARARESNAINAAGIGKAEIKAETDLRKEFNSLPIAKDFNDVRMSMGKVRGLANKKDATAADDIALIFSYMKMLDPGSVVREGEFANAQNAAGVPDRVVNAYNRALKGNMLNAEQRRKFGESAAQVYLAAREQYNAKADEYRRVAQDYGVVPDRVASKYVGTRKSEGPRKITGDDDYNALPSGAVFIAPDGSRRRKP